MSLSLTLNTALTGLRTNQSVLNVLSHNIANANTAGYSRQIAHLEALTIEGRGSGVSIADITRNVDLYLQRAARTQTSQVGQDKIISEYMDRIQLILGEPASDTSLNAYVDNFFTSMQDLADSPESASVRENLVRSADTLARNLSDLALQLEDLRYEADQEITRTINLVNARLAELYDVNLALASATVFGQNKSGLLDQRDALLEEISQYVDIRVLFQKDDQAYVSAAGGAALVDYDLHKLFYSPATSVVVFTGNGTLGAIEIGVIDPDTGVEEPSVREQLFGTGQEGVVTTDQQKGGLLGLVNLRDVIIPQALNSLDEFAQTFRDEMNALHNKGAGFPPPDELTGQLYVDPTEVREWLGSMRMAVVNPDGSPLINYQDTTLLATHERGGFRPLTLNFDFDSGEGAAGQHSTQTIIDEINEYFGIQTKKVQVLNMSDIKLVSMVENNPPGLNFTFDLDLENITNEQSQIQITGLNVINGVAGPVPASAFMVDPGEKLRTGAGYSFDVTSTGGVMQIQVTADITNVATGQVETVQIEYTLDPLTQTNIRNDRFVGTIISPPSANARELMPLSSGPVARALLVDENGDPVSSGESGFLKIETYDSDHRIVMDEMDSYDNGRLFATPPVAGTGRGFSHYYGLNNFFTENDNRLAGGTDDFVNSALDFAVRADILASPSLVAAGRLVRQDQPADPNDGPLYTYEHNVGNKFIAQEMADLGLTQVQFDNSDLLPITTQTISAFASSILGATSSQAKFATLAFEQSTFLLEGMNSRQDAIQGVNLDEELANVLIYQNAYSATARVISTVGEMFDELLSIVG